MGLWPNPKEAGMRDTTIDGAEGRLTVGLDVGDTYSQACVLDEACEVIEESRVATTPKAFRRRFATMPPARVVLEAGNHSHWARHCSLVMPVRP
jgi:hypothetical protein